MKKFITTIFSILLTLSMLANPVFAAETQNIPNVSGTVIYSSEEYLGDGFYGRCEITEHILPYATLATTSTKNRNVDLYHYK